MADNIVPFQRKRRRQQQAKRRTLCRNGHHRWAPDKATRFDVEQGRLVTVERCEHCGATRNRLT